MQVDEAMETAKRKMAETLTVTKRKAQGSHVSAREAREVWWWRCAVWRQREGEGERGRRR